MLIFRLKLILGLLLLLCGACDDCPLDEGVMVDGSSARRSSLEDLCDGESEGCPSFEELDRWECEPAVPVIAGEAAGIDRPGQSQLLRTEGCGRVQFYSGHEYGSRSLSYNAQSHKLVGIATFKDLVDGDGSCAGPALVGGKINEPCDEDRVAVCTTVCDLDPSFTIDGQAAARVPLEELCSNSTCPASLELLELDLDCEELNAASLDDDAGVENVDEGWVRSEGCNSVQLSFSGHGGPRIYNFDRESGDLIGAARRYDESHLVAGTDCNETAYVAGNVREACASESLAICR